MMNKKNLFNSFNVSKNREITKTLVSSKNIKIKKILSNNFKTKWYYQDKDEFVLLIKGSATLLFEKEKIKMKPGDYIIIPKHKRHKVIKTSSKTIWLTAYY